MVTTSLIHNHIPKRGLMNMYIKHIMATTIRTASKIQTTPDSVVVPCTAADKSSSMIIPALGKKSVKKFEKC